MIKKIQLDDLGDVPYRYTGIVVYEIHYNIIYYWYKEGLLHREDGPACEYANGDKSWYLDGNRYFDSALLELFNLNVFLGVQEGKYNLPWLKFFTENGITEFPIIAGMEKDSNFMKTFKKMEYEKWK